MEKELIDFIITDCSTRFMSLFEIPFARGWDVPEGCIRDTLRRQGFNRRHARVKLYLNEKHRRERLKWARKRLYWDIPKWRSFLWTEETSMQCLDQLRGMVTRHKQEEHDLDCIEPKFKKLSQYIFWASFSGLKGKGMPFYNFIFCC
jgi:hypothetical protein